MAKSKMPKGAKQPMGQPPMRPTKGSKTMPAFMKKGKGK